MIGFSETLPDSATAGIAPTSEVWKTAEDPYFKVVRELEPDVILVLGNRLWDKVPNLPSDYPVEWCGITHPSGGMAYEPSIAALVESIAKASGMFAKREEQL